MKKILVMLFMFACSNSDDDYLYNFIETTNCSPCLEGQFTKRLINCVPVQHNLSDVGLVGTWMQNTRIPDDVEPVLDVRVDGTLRRIYDPGQRGIEANQIKTTTWKFDGDIFSENGAAKLAFDRASDRSISWKSIPDYYIHPWVRVECEGFGFGGRDLPKPSQDCDCRSDETCDFFLDSRICLPSPKPSS